jgi:hypothetical protein
MGCNGQTIKKMIEHVSLKSLCIDGFPLSLTASDINSTERVQKLFVLLNSLWHFLLFFSDSVVYASSIDAITDYITSDVASSFTATGEMYFIPLTWRRSVVFFGYSATVKLKYYKSNKSTRLTLLTKYILYVTSKSEGGNNK